MNAAQATALTADMTARIDELERRLDILKEAVVQMQANQSVAAKQSDATPRKKFPVQLNGTDIWHYDVDGLEFIEDKNQPGRDITFVTTKNGKKIPVDKYGIVVFDDQYDLLRDHMEKHAAGA